MRAASRRGDVLKISLKDGAIILVKDASWEKFHGCARGLTTAENVERELDEDENVWEKRLERVIVDTYALMVKATGEITLRANECLEDVRGGKLKGAIHPLITYEFMLQFHRGRTPIFETPEEALGFLETYFSTVELSNKVASTAAEIRFKNGGLFSELKRELSACDSITIAVAKKLNALVITEDKGLKQWLKKKR